MSLFSRFSPEAGEAVGRLWDATHKDGAALLVRQCLNRPSGSEPADDPAASVTTLFDMIVMETKQWEAEPLVWMIDALTKRLERHEELVVDQLRGWLKTHDDKPAWAVLCIELVPPDQVQIERVLSFAGQQKVVYLARWGITDRQIVLKDFIDEGAADALMLRELQLHPLSMAHPNIIETHKLTNSGNKPFLAERYLFALSDSRWRGMGAVESGSLLHDICCALAFVHERNRVHADIKPDNIGYSDSRYILLDFGVARKLGTFAPGSTAGSLRTRAPKLFDAKVQPDMSTDVWAVGATVFHGLFGRFPLFAVEDLPDDDFPKRDDPRRARLDAAVESRRNDETWWKEHIEAPLRDANIHRKLAETVLAMLQARMTVADDVARHCRAELAALVRGGTDQRAILSLTNRVESLRHFTEPGRIELMPRPFVRNLLAEVDELTSENTGSLTDDQVVILDRLHKYLSAAAN